MVSQFGCPRQMFRSSTWSLAAEVAYTHVGADLATAVLRLDYRDRSDGGEPVHKRSVLTLVFAIPIACPKLVWVIRHNHAIGPCCVGQRCDDANEPRRLTDNGIGSCVHDVDTEVVSVRQIVLLGPWIKPADVKAPSAIWGCGLGWDSLTVRVC